MCTALEGNEGGGCSILSLPDDVLLKLLLPCGARTVVVAGSTCRHLRALQKRLAQMPCFGCGMALERSTQHDLPGALRRALDLALSQMHAPPQFALVFVTGYAAKRTARSNEAPPVAGSLLDMPQLLARALPRGTAVVGCSGRGLFGLAEDGPDEIDPIDRRSAGISLLLGHLPGQCVRAFAASGAPPGEDPAAIAKWTGLPASARVQLAVLLSRNLGSREANILPTIVQGLRAAYPGVVVAGGLAAGPRVLFYQPGSARGGGGAAVGEVVNPQPAKPGYVGLAIWQEPCGGCGGPPAAPPAPMPARDAREPPAPHLGVAALAVRGLAPVGGINDPTNLDVSGPTGGAWQPGAVFFGLELSNLPNADLPSTHHDLDQDEVLVRITDASDGLGHDVNDLLHACMRLEGPLWFAFWHESDDVVAASANGVDWAGAIMPEVDAVPGHEVVVGEVYDHMDVLIAGRDVEKLHAMAQQPGGRLCGQLLKMNSEAAHRTLEVELSTLLRRVAPAPPRSVPSSPAGPPASRQVAAAAHALLSGGPDVTTGAGVALGLVSFICTGRGQVLHGSEGMREAAHYEATGLPFAGVFLDGELGPPISDGQRGTAWNLRGPAGSVAGAASGSSPGGAPDCVLEVTAPAGGGSDGGDEGDALLVGGAARSDAARGGRWFQGYSTTATVIAAGNVVAPHAAA